MEGPLEPERGGRCVALSAALHAAVLGLTFLVPPGADALALDDLYAPRPRTFLVLTAPPAPSVASAAAPTGAGAVAASTPSDAGARPRASGTRQRGRSEPRDVLAAIAGRLSAYAGAPPAFVAATALAERGETEMRVDGLGLDMIGVGRGAGRGGDTIGVPELSIAGGGGGQSATCSGEVLAARTAIMGRSAAIASCSGARIGGLTSRGVLATNGVARDAPDAIESSPRHGVFHCGCGPFDAQGSLEPEVIRRIVARHRSEIRGCYQRALERRPDLEGRATARWVIAPSGGVRGSTIDADRSDTNDASVEACIASAVSRWTFPPSSGPTVVSYPFVLGTSE